MYWLKRTNTSCIFLTKHLICFQLWVLYAQDNCLFDLQKPNKQNSKPNKKTPNKTQTNTQRRTIRFFKNYIMFLSLHVHFWFMQFSWSAAMLMQSAWKLTEKLHGNQNFFQQWFLCFSRKARLQWVQEHD